MKVGCIDYARKYDKCQRFAKIHRSSGAPLNPILSPWSLSMWGIDLVGSLSRMKGRYKYLVVAVNYFTKWVKIKPLVEIPYERVFKFIWKMIICRYGMPFSFIIDHDTQFDNQNFEDYYTRFKSENYTPLRGTHSAMVKLRSPTRQSWTESGLFLMTQRGTGSTSSIVYSGHIGPHHEHLLDKHRIYLHSAQKRSPP